MGTSLAEAFGVFDKDGSGFVTAAELEEGLRGLGVFDAIPKEQVIAQRFFIFTSATVAPLVCLHRRRKQQEFFGLGLRSSKMLHRDCSSPPPRSPGRHAKYDY